MNRIPTVGLSSVLFLSVYSATAYIADELAPAAQSVALETLEPPACVLIDGLDTPGPSPVRRITLAGHAFVVVDGRVVPVGDVNM